MTRRPRFVPLAVLLFACLAVLTACKKKPTESDPGPAPDPAPAPPAAVSSDYVLFAHLRAKDVRDSALFAEVKQAVAKADGSAEWDKVEEEAGKEIGVKPTDIDSVTVFVTEVPARGEPKAVLIVAANTPINKAAAGRLGKAKPDARGFYKVGGGGLLHFPDDKTLVMVHPDLAQQYLDGYAKDRSGWPMTADLTRAASGHTLYATVNVQKLPLHDLPKREVKEFGPLLKAQTVTLTANLKGKEVRVAGRASFPDAATAGQAKDKAQEFIGMATAQVEKVMTGKGAGELGALQPAVKEAHRALKAAKVDVSGSDLTVAAGYKADFDIGAVVADAVKRIREASVRMTASNSLRQIGLGLHNYSSAHGVMPVHGVGPKGAPLKNAKEKPLLSWRVALLPFIEQGNLYRQFKHDEPWDSEHNKKLIPQMPKVYAPAKPGKPGYTHLQMVIGPSAMQPTAARFPNSFPDGTSNTIAVVEAAEPVVWTKPDDVMLPGKELPKDLKKRFGGLHPGGFNVLLWDGSVRFIRDSVSDRTLGIALNPSDGMVLPSDW
jgi:prepilin-type processing-associated H-X9-DG protein